MLQRQCRSDIKKHFCLRGSHCFRLTAEAIKSIKEQLGALKFQNRALQSRVDEEVNARKRLEIILKNNLLPNRSDIEWNNDV